MWNVTTNGLNAVTAISYTNWDPGQLDQSGEVCVSLHSDYSYRWFDWYCTSVACAVCEVDL